MQHEHHRVPVTALAFWRHESYQIILAGEGHYLTAYDSKSRDVLATARIFSDQAIHGIIHQPAPSSRLLIWGGCLIRHVDLCVRQDGTFALTLSHVLKAADWILDATFCEHVGEQDSKVILVTAHNALLLHDRSNDLQSRKIAPLIDGSNCILYSAHVQWLSPSKCLIASGTAFGDVIFWSCSLDQGADGFVAETAIHYTFSAHEGSVFGVRISSAHVAFAVDSRKHILATCSDDRTIRLWDVSDLTRRSASLTEIQRQTGFGANAVADSESPVLLAKAMGHQSRIWHVRFLESPAQAPIAASILSFGEDASCIQWDVKQCDNSDQYELRQVSVQRMHTGKHIWSVAGPHGNLLATGGADGAISLVAARSNDNTDSHQTLNGTQKSDKIKTYGFVAANKLIAITERGQVIIMNTHNGKDMLDEVLSPPIAALAGYSMIVTVRDVAYLAGADGTVFEADLTSTRTVNQVAKTKGKVAGLFTQELPPGRDGSRSTALLVTNVGSHIASLFRLPAREDLRLVTQRHELSLPRGLVVTSFANLAIEGRNVVILGSRSGVIAVLTIPETSSTDADSHFTTFDNIHQKEAVTSLRLLESSRGGAGDRFVLSTGRDGTFAAHTISFGTGTKPEMATLHQLTLPFGPNVEGIGISRHDHVCVWGFRSKQFVVFDVTAQQEIMTVECGGAHRNWAFQLQSNAGTFVWTQASQLYFEKQDEPATHTIYSGGHGREIKSVAISSLDSAQQQLIATGAEDTDIKLSVWDKGSFRCVHTIRKHNTGIQALQWSRDGQFLFSSGGFEEFFVWKIHRQLPLLNFGVVCKSAHPRSGTSDLRIMSFHADDRSDCHGHGSLFNISMVYSDSTIALWQYRDQKWFCLGRGDYLTACLTQCLPLSESSSCLLTGSTDGHLAVWQLEVERQTMNWSLRHRVHQNAILCMVSDRLTDGSDLVVTGGDDNAIGLTRSVAPASLSTLLIAGAHAAAVTGLAILKSESRRLWFASAGLDQKIIIWRVDIDVTRAGIDAIDIRVVRKVFTSVADVSGVARIHGSGDADRLLVCGVGMEMWKLEPALWS